MPMSSSNRSFSSLVRSRIAKRRVGAASRKRSLRRRPRGAVLVLWAVSEDAFDAMVDSFRQRTGDEPTMTIVSPPSVSWLRRRRGLA